MDVAGAQELQKRLEQQAHWLQAEAVREGRQPRTDPDVLELEELGTGVRFYRREPERASFDGSRAGATLRVAKRLVGGYWKTEIEIEVETDGRGRRHADG